MSRYGYLIAIIASACWGYVFSQTENLLDKMSPITSLASFYVFGGILLFPFLILNKKEVTNIITVNAGSFISTALMIMLAEFLMMWSISLLGGTEAAFIEVSYPLWTVIFSLLLFGLIPNTPTIFGGLLIILGSYIISKY